MGLFGMFFGFWSGEILRALGIYSLYKMGKPAQGITMEDSATVMMLKDAVETSRRNEIALSKIFGGLIVLGALQAGFVGAGAWVVSTSITNSQELQVAKEQIKTLQLKVSKLDGDH